MTKQTGRCMCGAIEYSFEVDNANVTACHCGQCRKWSGHIWASLNVAFESLKISRGEDHLGWFKSSDYARRGFCKACGSALFWHGENLPEHKHRIAVAAGTVETPTGLEMAEHIFMCDKGDYYGVSDGLPQKETH